MIISPGGGYRPGGAGTSVKRPNASSNGSKATSKPGNAGSISGSIGGGIKGAAIKK